ncbi:suppressor of fused domain protein [Bremerella cremea]|uniref:Suppressor of fused protein (SUFU) n=1 Tax=Blastopirellula marina TaxID=124 RepID=A0A2S8FPE8_9BACT|nr:MULTISPECIES: suppressor of fused domain protein [Pirellulaceae]PQO34063.1 Suppressor of fused protein (SUFU) [Blastopirellula marina]RCS46559.1 suppressor of fused domain protein [Bremerella cremea]
MSDELLLEQLNPNGNVQAVVESAGGVINFYLWSDPELEAPMKTVWVRNLAPAPDKLDVEGMQEGRPPLNPIQFCRHPEGLAAPNADDLRVIWLPEGNGAALVEREEILAIIPPWSGVDGFDGFARDQVGEGPVAWELSDDNVLIKRFRDADAYWQSWEDDSPWGSVQNQLLSQVEERFGPHEKYYAIDGGNWPPKALVRIPYEDGTLLVTLGVSLRPQPNVELSHENPEDYRRIELGVLLPHSWNDEQILAFGSNLSGNAGYPWSNYTWLGSGHSIPCSRWSDPQFSMAILSHEHPRLEKLELGPVFGDPVNLLWYLPITGSERQIAIEEGSQRLLEQLPSDRWQQA